MLLISYFHLLHNLFIFLLILLFIIIVYFFYHSRDPSHRNRVWVVPRVHQWGAPKEWCPTIKQVWSVLAPRFLPHLLQLVHRPQLTLKSASWSSSNWYSCFMHTSASAGSRQMARFGSATCLTAAQWRTSSTTWLTARLASPVRVSRRDAACSVSGDDCV